MTDRLGTRGATMFDPLTVIHAPPAEEARDGSTDQILPSAYTVTVLVKTDESSPLLLTCKVALPKARTGGERRVTILLETKSAGTQISNPKQALARGLSAKCDPRIVKSRPPRIGRLDGSARNTVAA
eukprot:2424704-Rhodomonas_salina.3